MIKVVPIEGKGRGVVATRRISAGTVVSECPFLTFPLGSLDGTPIENHVWSDEDASYLSLGVITLVNHSESPNCISEIADGMDVLKTARAVGAGEELTIDYRTFCPNFEGY